MTFTTPCFVRVEDAAERQILIEWLLSIGHKRAFVNINQEVLTCGCGAIDCGTNVEMFKALAAMNDTTDREQWFVAKKNISDYYDIDDIVYQKGDMFFNESGEPLLDKHFRKATAEEIVEYFTKKYRDSRKITK